MATVSLNNRLANYGIPSFSGKFSLGYYCNRNQNDIGTRMGKVLTEEICRKGGEIAEAKKGGAPGLKIVPAARMVGSLVMRDAVFSRACAKNCSKTEISRIEGGEIAAVDANESRRRLAGGLFVASKEGEACVPWKLENNDFKGMKITPMVLGVKRVLLARKTRLFGLIKNRQLRELICQVNNLKQVSHADMGPIDGFAHPWFALKNGGANNGETVSLILENFHRIGRRYFADAVIVVRKKVISSEELLMAAEKSRKRTDNFIRDRLQGCLDEARGAVSGIIELGKNTLSVLVLHTNSSKK